MIRAMNYNPEEIQTLIIARIMGDISDQDNTYLDKLIAENEDIRLLYEDMHSSFHSQEAIAARKNLDQKVHYTDLISNKRRSYRFAFSAAASLLVIFGIYAIMKRSTPAPVAVSKS